MVQNQHSVNFATKYCIRRQLVCHSMPKLQSSSATFHLDWHSECRLYGLKFERDIASFVHNKYIWRRFLLRTVFGSFYVCIYISLHYRWAILKLTWQCMLGNVDFWGCICPYYVADLQTRRWLDVRPLRLVIVCDRSFFSARPWLWNSLPKGVQSASSLATFHWKLKLHLFRQSCPDVICSSSIAIMDLEVLLFCHFKYF